MVISAIPALTLRRSLASLLLVLAFPAAADIDLSILRAGTDGAPVAATGNSAAAIASQPVVVPAESPEDWYRRATALDRPDASASDLASASYWYTKAANKGHTDAQTNLAAMYAEGRGVDLDGHQAARWYRRAAEGGLAAAQSDLGLLYMRGVGVPQDMDRAIFWFRKAADQGEALAQFNLGNLYRLELRKYAEAAKWYRMAAEQGWSPAQVNLGHMYVYGQGVRKSYRNAVKWLRKAAENGNAKGQYNLGILYEDGLGVRRDLVQTYKWYRLAAGNSQRLDEKYTILQALDEVSRKMTPTQIAEAQRLAQEWRPER